MGFGFSTPTAMGQSFIMILYKLTGVKLIWQHCTTAGDSCERARDIVKS
jgi:hypothetical protein